MPGDRTSLFAASVTLIDSSDAAINDTAQSAASSANVEHHRYKQDASGTGRSVALRASTPL